MGLGPVILAGNLAASCFCLISVLPPLNRREILTTVPQGLLDEIHRTSKAQLEATQAQTQQNKIQHECDKHSQCHQTFKIGPYEEQKDINPKTSIWYLPVGAVSPSISSMVHKITR